MLRVSDAARVSSVDIGGRKLLIWVKSSAPCVDTLGKFQTCQESDLDHRNHDHLRRTQLTYSSLLSLIPLGVIEYIPYLSTLKTTIEDPHKPSPPSPTQKVKNPKSNLNLGNRCMIGAVKRACHDVHFSTKAVRLALSRSYNFFLFFPKSLICSCVIGPHFGRRIN